MKRILILTILLSFVLNGRSQEDANSYKHSIGLHAGLASGYGFSYRFWPDRIGFQVTAIPILSTDRITSSSGLSLLVKINDFSKVRLYSYAASHLHYSRYEGYDIFGPIINEDYSIFSALGVGLRVNFLEVLDFNLQTGYGVVFSQSSFSANNWTYNTTLDIGAGLYFHF